MVKYILPIGKKAYSMCAISKTTDVRLSSDCTLDHCYIINQNHIIFNVKITCIFICMINKVSHSRHFFLSLKLDKYQVK